MAEFEGEVKDSFVIGSDRIFINPANGETYEHVFMMVEDVVMKPTKRSSPQLQATEAVLKRLPALQNIARTIVGRFIVLMERSQYTDVKTPTAASNPNKYFWMRGTAFFVAPNVVVTANHYFPGDIATEKRYDARMHFFSTKDNFNERLLDILLRDYEVRLDGCALPQPFIAQLERHHIYLATPLNKSPFYITCVPQEARANTLVDLDKNGNPIPRNFEPTSVPDFSFFSVSYSSASFFIPSHDIPIDDDVPIALIAHSHMDERVDATEVGGTRWLLKVFGNDLKYISPGMTFPAATSNVGLAHRANAVEGAAGGVVVWTCISSHQGSYTLIPARKNRPNKRLLGGYRQGNSR